MEQTERIKNNYPKKPALAGFLTKFLSTLSGANMEPPMEKTIFIPIYIK